MSAAGLNSFLFVKLNFEISGVKFSSVFISDDRSPGFIFVFMCPISSLVLISEISRVWGLTSITEMAVYCTGMRDVRSAQHNKDKRKMPSRKLRLIHIDCAKRINITSLLCVRYIKKIVVLL